MAVKAGDIVPLDPWSGNRKRTESGGEGCETSSPITNDLLCTQERHLKPLPPKGFKTL